MPRAARQMCLLGHNPASLPVFFWPLLFPVITTTPPPLFRHLRKATAVKLDVMTDVTAEALVGLIHRRIVCSRAENHSLEYEMEGFEHVGSPALSRAELEQQSLRPTDGAQLI